MRKQNNGTYGFQPIIEIVDEFINKGLGDFIEYKSNRAPKTNFKEVENGYEFELKVPGIPKEAIEMEIIENKLKISADISKDAEDSKYFLREFTTKSFSRLFNLPNNLDHDKITAKYDLGILKVYLAKQERSENERTKIVID